MTGGSEKLEAARAYVARGWALVPLQPGSKEPFHALLPRDRQTGRASWKPLAARPATEAEVKEWCRSAPDLNLGVICGEPSGLLVLDIDNPSVDLASALPSTVEALSGRGRHLYYRSADGYPTQKLDWGEIRSNGSYVVVPPSLHPNGEPYRWLNSPSDIELADLPADWHGATVHAIEVPEVESFDPVDPAASELGAWFSREDVALACARLMGAPPSAELGQAFKCILPGHNERRASASLTER